jgi:hypothetical protein
VVEKEATTLMEQVDMRVKWEVHVNSKAAETGCDVATKSNVGDGHKETLALISDTIVGRGVQLVHGREGMVEWSEKFDIGKFARVQVLEPFRKSKNGPYATGTISCSRRGS